MAAVLDLAGVSIVRNGSTLINDINWEVDESDRWVVVGPNGAGKTTLLQVISAQIHPTSGVAGLLGEVLALLTSSNCARASGSPQRHWRSAFHAANGSMTSWSPPRTRSSAGGASSTTSSTTDEPMSYSLSCT
jgi:ATPase subunit of ABC transporter with duplicated ATPase domains